MKLKRCVVLSDSFKGSLTSREICGLVREEAEKLVPDCTVLALPMADGGEGTGVCLRELLGGNIVKVKNITGPLGDKLEAEYVLLADGTAVPSPWGPGSWTRRAGNFCPPADRWTASPTWNWTDCAAFWRA